MVARFLKFQGVLLGASLALISNQALSQQTVPVTSFLDKATVKTAGDALGAKATIAKSRATFTVDGEEVKGTVSMLERLNELRAVAILEDMKKSDVYVDAVKNSAKAPVNYGKSLVDAPVDTLKDTAKGLGSFLADVGHSVVSDDPNEDNVAKTGLGFATAKRNFAFELGVNPYSQYQPLQDAMGEVAWTAVGGGLTVGAAFRAVQNMPGQVLTTTRIANTGRALVRDNSPRKLSNINEEKLLAMGAGQEQVDTLLDNYNYDPEARTRLVAALDSMKDVKGRGGVVSRAGLADSHTLADEMRDWVELLAAYHESVKPAKQIVVIASAPMLIDANNNANGVFPTDYIMNAQSVEKDISTLTATVKAFGFGLGEIYTTGKMDPTAKKLLLDSGWAKAGDHAERKFRTQ